MYYLSEITMRIRLSVPLNLFLNSPHEALLDLPPLTFEHNESVVLVVLKGAAPLKVDSGSEPYFRTIHECQIEVRPKSQAAHKLLELVQSNNFAELSNLLMPIVNKALLAIRNFGSVTTAREYKPEQKPEKLLRAWATKARIHREWREVAPKPPQKPFDLFYGLTGLDQNVERGSLSVSHWPDIEEALIEGLKPNAEQEFLTNALQHLREENLRLALVEATVCLEIVLSEYLKLYFALKRKFSKRKIGSLLNNVDLMSRVGLIVDSMLTYDERRDAQVDKVLQAIKLRNGIIHKTGHLDPSVPLEEVQDVISAMLNLALTLSRKKEKIKAEPEVRQIAEAIATDFNCPKPEIEILKHHEVSATFSFHGKTPLYLRAIGRSLPVDDKIPDEKGLKEIIKSLASKLKERDSYFDVKKHLTAKFQTGVLGPVVFATFEKGQWKYIALSESS
jgi:hypothetical protein